MSAKGIMELINVNEIRLYRYVTPQVAQAHEWLLVWLLVCLVFALDFENKFVF